MTEQIKITAKTDLKAFRQQRKREVAARLSKSGKHCKEAVGVYFRWLAQYTPPSIGQKELSSKIPGVNIYERPATLLPIAIARGGKNLAADRAALAQGYSWKVVKKNKTEYFKGRGRNGTLPPAVKKAQHIVNRGLLRWAFVGVLPNVGVAVPTVMRPLAAAKRGKNLKKNENAVATATLIEGAKELIIRVRQHMHAAGKGNWYSLAAKKAEQGHDEYLVSKLAKFGKVSKR